MRYLWTISLLFSGCDGSSNFGNSARAEQSEYISDKWYRPDIKTTWYWQLQGDINTSQPAKLYDIDLFDTDISTIEKLHQEGKKVICYFSAGSYENWREDKNRFPDEVIGNPLDEWEGERWLDISNPSVREIMKGRLDLALKKGCDGVEPDNVDGYLNNTGFNISPQEQLDYNIFLANEAHKRGLAIGLKNDLEQIPKLLPYFDFAINEECYQYQECEKLFPFVDSNKPVFHVEYSEEYVQDYEELCRFSKNHNFQTLILPKELDGSWIIRCK